MGGAKKGLGGGWTGVATWGETAETAAGVVDDMAWNRLMVVDGVIWNDQDGLARHKGRNRGGCLECEK